MSLEWTIQYGVLVADSFESKERHTKYNIHQNEAGWCARAIRTRDGATKTDHTPSRLELAGLLDWCERDAVKETSAAQANDEDLVPKKFPSTLEAPVWASRCTAWFGAFKVPDLTEWFQAALSHGFREGQASVYELVDKAQRQRDILGPFDPPRAIADFLKNAVPPPSTPAPEPPSVVAPFTMDEMQERLMYLEGVVQSGHCQDRMSVAQLAEKQKVDDEIRFTQIQLILQRMNQNDIKVSAGFEKLKERQGLLEERMRDLVSRHQELECKVPPLPPSVEERLAALEAKR